MPGDSMNDSLYSLLGLDEKAQIPEIKRAYRKLSKIYHPDSPTGDKEKFLKINQAYRVLINPGSRLLYDTTGNADRERIDYQVRDILLECFRNAIQSNLTGAVLEFSRNYISLGVSKRQQEITKLKKEIWKLTLRKKNIETDLEENLYEQIIDNFISDKEKQINDISLDIEAAGLALEVLTKYREHNNLNNLIGLLNEAYPTSSTMEIVNQGKGVK
jgi:curved DNA-binding protein CbpA